MDSFQFGIITGMIIMMVLITYFMFSFRKFKKDIMTEVIERIERNGKE